MHTVENFWLPVQRGFIGAAWHWPRRDLATPVAVLVVAGIAHEERGTSGGVVALAETLADAGMPALSIDLHGTAQGSGRLDADDIGARWRDDVCAALQHVRSSGFDDVVVVGVRLGALLAFEALRREAVLGLVAWSPIASGRRHLREVKVLAAQGAERPPATGALSVAGFDIPAAAQDHLASLDLAQIDGPCAPALLLLDAAERLDPRWLDTRGERGTDRIDRRAARDTAAWLEWSGEQPTLPLVDIGAIAGWCAALRSRRAGAGLDVDGASGHAPAATRRAASVQRPSLARETVFGHAGRPVRERHLRIEPYGLGAVLCEPADGDDARRGAARLLMSTVGPGRAFVDFARDEAALGRASLRFDFAGFGTSARGSGARGGELYTARGRRDVAAAVDHLRRSGHDRIVVIGFCAGAWSMLQAGPLDGVRAAVAINVALYRQPGPATETRAAWRDEATARLRELSDRWPRVRRLLGRIERSSRARRQPVDWLVAWRNASIPVRLVYADDDPGLPYLQTQFANGLQAQLQPHVALRIYAGLGHLLDGADARRRLLDDVARFCARVDRDVGERPAPTLRPAMPAFDSAFGPF